jgi:hypothetical protein
MDVLTTGDPRRAGCAPDAGRARAGAARALARHAIVATALAAAAPAGAAVFASAPQALASAFPGARIERHAFALTGAQATAAEARARARLGSRLVTVYAAWRGDTLAGTAFLDTRVVRTMPGTFLVFVAPDTTVSRVEVLAFHEPPDYLPPRRWLGLFGRRRLDDDLWPQRGIRSLSGATLSARAVTESTRLALALYPAVVAPELRARAVAR